ncbi:MAG: hypothetical protein JWQ89_4117 [Devosia sp.]|nr:hypothetical protein [Devosia sp.]
MRLHRLHARLAWLLLIIVVAAAIPLGSARPFFWALFAVLIGAAGLYYGLGLERTNNGLRRTPIGWFAAVGFGVLCVFLLAQALPLPWPSGLVGDLMTRDGTVLALSQISLAPGNTLLMLVQMLSYGLLVLLVTLVGANRYRRLRMLDALFLVIVVHAAYSVIALTQLGDIVLIFPKWAYEGVATGTFVNRNSFATYLAIGLVLGTALTLDEIGYRMGADRLTRAKDGGRPVRSLTLHIVGLLVVMSALLATQSRMGAAAALLGVLVVAIPLIAALPLRSSRRLLIGLAALVPAVALFQFYGLGLLERLGSVEGAADVRRDLYAQVIEMISARPWAGYGGAAFEVAFPLFHRPPVSADLVWDKAHNTYLALWAELGIVVGSIPILILLWFGVRLLRSCVTSPDRVAQLVALGALAAVALHSFVDFSLEIEANALLLLMLVALGLAALRPRASGKLSEGVDGK